MAPPIQLHSHPHPNELGHAHLHDASPQTAPQTGLARARRRSVLAWPAWLRVATVMPLLCLLWLAVWWANDGVSPW
jgi:hypothetical protein